MSAVKERVAKGAVLVNGPEKAESYWQPVPANGHIDVLLAPHLVAMEHPFAMGTQTVAPGSYVREHSHDRNEEALIVLEGRGKAVIEGKELPMGPGTVLFLGKNNRHMFINEGEGNLKWVWLIIPNGLEDFFREIGRPRQAGDKVPVNFPRPANVLEIERRTVFAAQPEDQRQP
ncbi:cupin domain-containing protein [Taklimakanibacter lacteus]|uniref:cupin domain-containing protein n=1 Tax=Taklimakanibacter lacteus TaxID=2268456 RepID=UPI000E66B7DE